MITRFVVIIFLAWAAVLVIIMCSAVGAAQPQYIRQMDQLWLARAAIAEVGWPNTRRKQVEHVAVWHVLQKRWQQMTSTGKFPNLRLMDVARLYCSALKSRSPSGVRQTWIRDLNLHGVAPVGWPEDSRWSIHQRYWKDTLYNARRFLEGRFRNPCPGASHFGSKSDVPMGMMELHECSHQMQNHFYKVRKP